MKEIKLASVRLIAPSIVHKGKLQFSAPEFDITLSENHVSIIPKDTQLPTILHPLSNCTEMVLLPLLSTVIDEKLEKAGLKTAAVASALKNNKRVSAEKK